MLDFVTLVGVQYGRANRQERGMCSGGGRLGAPDDTVQDGWGHQRAVEEGCVGHVG